MQKELPSNHLSILVQVWTNNIPQMSQYTLMDFNKNLSLLGEYVEEGQLNQKGRDIVFEELGFKWEPLVSDPPPVRMLALIERIKDLRKTASMEEHEHDYDPVDYTRNRVMVLRMIANDLEILLESRLGYKP